MQYYQAHYERLSLSEMMRSNPKRPISMIFVWLLLKFRIASVKSSQPSICAVKETATENLLERDQIPQHLQAKIDSFLEELESHGFVDPLFEGLKSGSCDIDLKLDGVSVLARHKSGDCVACIAAHISGSSDIPTSRTLQTFVDPENVIVTMNGRKVFNDTPGCDVRYCKAESLAELIPRHRKRVAELVHACEVISSQAEMLEWRQHHSDRADAALVKRRYLTRHIPDGPALPDFVDYDAPPGKDANQDNPLVLRIIFLVVSTSVIIYLLMQHK